MQVPSDTNPYRLNENEYASNLGAGASPRVDFVPILHRWEKFRLWYNATLITLTLTASVLLAPHFLFRPDYWIQLFVGGLLTNLCFFTGPAIEGYGRYLGIWNIAMSLGLFLAGLFFTSLLAIGFVFVNTR